MLQRKFDSSFESSIAFSAMKLLILQAGTQIKSFSSCQVFFLAYKRQDQLGLFLIPFSFKQSTFLICSLSSLKFSKNSFSFIMATSHSFKDAILANPNPSLSGMLNGKNSKVNPNASSSVPESHSHDPPPPPSFPEAIVLDDLPRVKIDIEELSKSYLFDKMLSAALDVRTIRARTKVDWKFIKGEVEYLEMGNNWLLLKFSNPSDVLLVWSERPWHVDLLILQPWKPFFDPYLEEIKWVDLWVRIPRLPTEILNFDSIANLFSS